MDEPRTAGEVVPRTDCAPEGSSRPACLILVVEDNPITRGMLRVTLEIGGYEILDAGDAETAIAIAAKRRPDLLILDFVLPDMDGLELLVALRRTLEADVPAIVVTGMVSQLAALRARSGGSVHFLAKPVEPSALLKVVEAELTPRRGRSEGRRVLVVDDDALNRKLTSVRLESAGYLVETVSSGEEALAVARRLPPDAIVSDVMMPSMDGFSFCREARLDPALSGVPIILVSSAHVDDADRELARQMGANALVARTPDLAAATAALDEALRALSPAPVTTNTGTLTDQLHRERLQVQIERQHFHSERLLRQAAIQGTALALVQGLSELMAKPREVSQVLSDALAHSLDAAGLSTGLFYLTGADGEHRLQAQFGLTADRKQGAAAFFGHPQLISDIIRAGRPAALSVATGGVDAAADDFVARLGQSSVLVVPVVVLGATYGAVVLASHDHDLTESAWTAFARNLALRIGQTVALGQSLKRLAESESRYRALVEQASDAIFFLDAQGTILEANRQSETLLALPRDRIIGRHIWSFSPLAEGETPPYLADFAATLAAGGGRQDGVILRRGDDTLVEVDFALSVNETDGRTSVLSIGRDVTQRNRDAAALREAQARLAHVVTSSPSVLYSLRPQGQGFALRWISGNIERMLGYTVEEAMAPEWWGGNLHPDDRERVATDQASLYDVGFLAHEYRHRHTDGAYRWLRAELRLLRDDLDAPTEAIGSWSDVTARKNAELRLRESEEEYRLLFDGNPHPMWVQDKDTFEFLAVNDAAVRQYGYSRPEFLAMTSFDIRPPEELAAFRERYDEGMAEYTSGTFHSDRSFKHRQKNGTVIEVDIAASGMVFGGRAAWLVLATDVTEKQTLQVQLLEAQKMEAVGQLAGGLAHDFNNLLGVVTGYSDLLIRELPTGSRARKRAEEIGHAADRAAALTRQLLAFSRRQVLQPKVLDLNDTVADVERMVRRLISANIQIVTVLAPDLGQVRADAGQVEQVLMNLVINARDAMAAGGRLAIETANVEVDDAYAVANRGARAGRSVVLTVSDSGHGMAPETMTHIFEPFFTTKEPGKGTGLGLATVYGIVRQSGGTVSVSSEPGRGTTFKVYLPRVEEPVPNKVRAEAVKALGGAETILLVEDAVELRALVRELLEDVGYTVQAADSPDAALAFLQTTAGPIDLVLTDIVMPRMSGLELARRIAAIRPDTRAVFMSGYADQVVGEEGTLPPDTLFLQKPFTMDALLTILRRALDEPVLALAGRAE